MFIWVRKNIYWFLCFFICVSVSFYWFFVATDRYVSETNVVLESPSVSNVSFSFSSLLSGGNSKDLLLLKDYMLSVDMLSKLDKELGLREHYSNSSIDFFSRLNQSAPIEEFHSYFQKRVHIEMDDYAQVLRIKVDAFEPLMAKKMAELILKFGESHMNYMGQRLAIEQVKFVENQVESLGKKLLEAREALITYQNANGLISPTSTVESINSVIAELEAELSNKQATLEALLSYQSKSSPDIIKITNEIKALSSQIDREKSRMTASEGYALNKITADYETLEIKAKFALDIYSNALSALESTRAESVRKLKQISILQSPTLAEYSIEPRRVHNAISFVLMAILITLIIQLLETVVREHKD